MGSCIRPMLLYAKHIFRESKCFSGIIIINTVAFCFSSFWVTRQFVTIPFFFCFHRSHLLRTWGKLFPNPTLYNNTETTCGWSSWQYVANLFQAQPKVSSTQFNFKGLATSPRLRTCFFSFTTFILFHTFIQWKITWLYESLHSVIEFNFQELKILNPDSD